MRWPCLLLCWCAVVPCEGHEAGSAKTSPNQSLASGSAAQRPRLAPPRYFVDGTHDPFAAQAVRAHMDRSVTLAGHYSRSVVPCGTECWSTMVVDRRTGAIIDVPDSNNEAELVVDVRGRRNSDVVEVIYGRAVERIATCRARSFRLRGTRFTPIGGYSSARCP